MSDTNDQRRAQPQSTRQESVRPESARSSDEAQGRTTASSSPYAQAMDSLRFTASQKEELKRSLLEQMREDKRTREENEAKAPVTTAEATRQGGPTGFAGSREPGRSGSRHMSRRRFVGLLVAAGLTAGAAGLAIAAGLARVDANDAAGDLFPQGPVDDDVISRISRTVGLSHSCNGVTVSLDSILGDKNNVAVIFSIYRDDGGELGCASDPATGDPVLVSMMSGISLISTEAGMGGTAYSYDADPTDNAMQYVCLSSSETPLVGEQTHVMIGDLLTYDDAGFRTIARGTWEFDVALDYEDTSHELEAIHTPVSRAGIDATIEHVLISPIGLTVELAASDASQWHEDGIVTPHNLDEQQEFANMPLALVMSDATTRKVVVSSVGASGIGIKQEPDGGTTASDPGPILLIARFDRIIDPSEVAAVRVCDVEIPVT